MEQSAWWMEPVKCGNSYVISQKHGAVGLACTSARLPCASLLCFFLSPRLPTNMPAVPPLGRHHRVGVVQLHTVQHIMGRVVCDIDAHHLTGSGRLLAIPPHGLPCVSMGFILAALCDCSFG